MKKFHKKIAALLIISVILSLMPAGTAFADEKYEIIYALQDSFTVLYDNEYTMNVGDQVDFCFFGAPSDWTTCYKGWTSSNKAVATVDNKGVVTAKSQGTAYITVQLGTSCTGSLRINVGDKVTLGSSAERAMNSLYLENISDTYDLNFYGVSDWNTVKSHTKLSWKSSDTKVATVNKIGLVKAVSAGKASISLLIGFDNGAAIETVPCEVTVDKTKIVSSQKELEKALKDNTLTKIVLRTEEVAAFEIPQGDYKNIKLVVDVPNADVVNRGVFKGICLANIAEDTFIENAVGNDIIITAAKAHVVVTDEAQVSNIRVIDTADNKATMAWATGTGFNNTVSENTAAQSKTDVQALNIEVNGNVENIVLDSNSDITIRVEGKVENVEVNSASDLALKGDASEAVSVVVSDAADGTKIDTNVKVDVDTSSKTQINLAGGAEGSVILAKNEEKAVSVENRTKQQVSVTSDKGAEIKIRAGRTGVMDLTVTATPTAAPVSSRGENTYTPTYSSSYTPEPTATPVLTATATPVPTATNTPVPTATSTPVPTATSTPVPTATNTPVLTATATPVLTATATPVPTATNTPVPTATNTPVPTATATPVPTATNTPVPTATNTPVPIATNTPVPTATNTPVPTATNTPVPTATNTPVPTATNTPVPTATNTPVPTATNTPVPTATNTPVPTA
ncbi:MAG: Ig-like domain-containing protein, partial [Lachnospiraceae bacterium]|nr:Ig-like domain-containing protein [Lachnospiraceae bacterium]